MNNVNFGEIKKSMYMDKKVLFGRQNQKGNRTLIIQCEKKNPDDH